MKKKLKNDVENFSKIKLFIEENADPIQKEATDQHKKYLGRKSMRIETITQYQNKHIKAVQAIGQHFGDGVTEKGTKFFIKIGEELGRDAVNDGLSIEEAIDGTIFLKQAIFKKLKQAKLIDSISVNDLYLLNQTIGIFIDTFASKLAFTYHKQRQYIEGNLNYLAEASKILSSTLDYQKTLNTIASLAVPEIADWCAVDLLDSKGVIKHVVVAHKDPKKVKWAKEFQKRQPVDMNAPTGVPNVLRTGKSEIYPEITDEMLVRLSKSKKDLEITRSLGFTSAMVVPLFSQNKPFGAITFVSTKISRHYNQADLIMAEELATRASVAIENARLYKGSQDAITVRDEFISVASHELKTPVTSVKMFIQVLKKHSEQIGDEKAVIHLSRIDKQVNKLTELIYDLLNVSKIQAGKMDFKYEIFDFDKSVKEIVNVLQQSSDKHKLILNGKAGKKIYGDEERIGQVVNNLVSNAIKYSPKAAEIIIKLSANQKNVLFSVKDYGIGMSKEHFNRIFERFYRAFDGNDKTFPGLGIGLYISSEIIKRHGGKLWVESIPGKGSTFSFSLPIDMRKNKKN
jgi:signal transduction histidine kinase